MPQSTENQHPDQALLQKVEQILTHDKAMFLVEKMFELKIKNKQFNDNSGSMNEELIITEDVSESDKRILDYICDIQAAASAAVSIKHLARKELSAHPIIFGIIGTNNRAECALDACLSWLSISNVKIEQCKIFDPDVEKAERFKEKIEAKYEISFLVEEYSTDFIPNLDIVLCVSESNRPVFNGNDLKPGTHVISLSHSNEHIREIDTWTLNRAQVITTDSKEGALKKSGEFIIPANEGMFDQNRVIEIGSIIMNEIEGRTSEEQITFFKYSADTIYSLVSKFVVENL